MSMSPRSESAASDRPAPAQPGRRFDPRLVLALLLLCAAFGLSGYLLYSDGQAHAANRTDTLVLGRSLGRELQTQGDVGVLANKLARTYLQQSISLQLGKKTYRETRSALGVQVDLPAFTALLRAASDPRSPLRRLHAQQRGDVALDLPVPAHLEGERAEHWLRALAVAYDEPARPVRVSFESSTVLAARAGQKLDVFATLDALANAVFEGSSQLRAHVVEQAPPAARFLPGDELDVSRVLGSFESAAPHSDGARKHDLAALARLLDGALLGPGEVFDLSAQLGDLHGGHLLRSGNVSLGEGDQREAVCSQVGSTLYAAALFAGLPVVEQHARVRPSSDIELGFDTAISAQSTLRFRNDLPHPLALSLSVREDHLRVSLRGSATHTREVDIERSIEGITPYVEVTRADPGLAAGALVLVQRGRPGLHIKLIRSVRESQDDSSQSEQRSAYYPPAPRIVRVGSGSGSQAAAASTALAEYVVDEFVAYGMRPGLALPQESDRRAGRTGVEGWTTQDGP